MKNLIFCWLAVVTGSWTSSCVCSGAHDRGAPFPQLDGAGRADDGSESAEPSRADWIRSEIQRWNQGLDESARREKYRRMARSPFRFFRGTNHLFWADFAGDPRLSGWGSESTVTWIQGDLHSDNYGAFDDDDGRVVYDLNDFDEAVIADYQYDLWRMGTSIVLLGHANGQTGDATRAAVEAFTESYLDTLESYRGNDGEQNRSFGRQSTYGRLDDFLEDVEEEGSRERMLREWTADGGQRLDTDLEDLEPLDELVRLTVIEALEEQYPATLAGGLDWDPSYFAAKDVARRLNAGTGSLGTPRYYVLIEGPTSDPDDDVLLDLKLQGTPSAEIYLAPRTVPSSHDWSQCHAERVALAARALGTDVDDHLGWLRLGDGCYGVRQRSPFKATFPTAELTSRRRLVNLAEQWGVILATGHARADRDFDARLVPLSFEAEVGRMTDGHHAEVRLLVWQVASTNAAQVEADYTAFLDIVD